MAIIYKRKINYYETDKMGIVHHSNYIRFLEEARCYMLEEIGYPYSKIEENGIMIPVLGVKCTYKHHVTYDDEIQIEAFVKEFTGVKMTVGYHVINTANNEIVIEAETKHCFTNNNLRPIALKKHWKELHEGLLKELGE